MPKSLSKAERSIGKLVPPSTVQLGIPAMRALATLAVVSALCLVGCVDLTEPWKQKATPAGTGGAGGGARIEAGAGGAGEMDAAADGSGGAIDSGLAGSGGGIDLGAGGAIDLGPSGTGGAIDAHADIPISGTGGVATGGMDGSATGGSISRTGGATGRGGATATGGTKATGGTTGTGGTKATGGATASGGVTGSGGRIGTGGATGTGGTMAPDAGPDLTPDLSPDTSTLGTGLVAYYTCESASGTTLADVSGNGNHGTLSAGLPPDGGTAPIGSAYSFASGKVGNALVLSKAGYGYVSLPPAVFAGLSNITIATWVHVTTSLAWQRIFDVGINANAYNSLPTGTKYMNLTPRNTDGNLRFSITSDGFSREESLNTTNLATGVWKHLTIVLSGGNGWLYIDGAQANTDPTVLTPAGLGAIDYAYLGKSQFGVDPYFDGMIDEFRVYNRALSATEIAALAAFIGP